MRTRIDKLKENETHDSTEDLESIDVLMDSIIAVCRTVSSIVGDCLPYLVPWSRRLTHRHTIFFFPRIFHVHLRYSVPHSPHTSLSERAYLLA